jgi:hypothetical protein
MVMDLTPEEVSNAVVEGVANGLLVVMSVDGDILSTAQVQELAYDEECIIMTSDQFKGKHL